MPHHPLYLSPQPASSVGGSLPVHRKQRAVLVSSMTVTSCRTYRNGVNGRVNELADALVARELDRWRDRNVS